MIEDYWGRYLGWPDLLVFKDEEYFFVEVKGRKDKLSQVQKEWVDANYSRLRMPFKLLKIVKRKATSKGGNCREFNLSIH